MPKWLKANVRMQSWEDLESRERMNLPDLEVTSLFRPIMIDLDHVITYSPLYNKDGDIVEGFSEATLVHGGTMSLEMEFDELDKAIQHGSN